LTKIGDDFHWIMSILLQFNIENPLIQILTPDIVIGS